MQAPGKMSKSVSVISYIMCENRLCALFKSSLIGNAQLSSMQPLCLLNLNYIAVNWNYIALQLFLRISLYRNHCLGRQLPTKKVIFMAPQPLSIDELATELTLIIIKLNCNGACHQPSSG